MLVLIREGAEPGGFCSHSGSGSLPEGNVQPARALVGPDLFNKVITGPKIIALAWGREVPQLKVSCTHPHSRWVLLGHRYQVPDMGSKDGSFRMELGVASPIPIFAKSGL